MSAAPEGPGTPARRGHLVAGTLAFVLLAPGSTVGLVPWLITRWRLARPPLGWTGLRWVGAAIIVAGFLVFADAVRRFLVEGRGTPAPIAAPERFVATGPYRLVRNPMYVGVLAMVAGQALLLASPWTGVYAVVLAAAFHLFVLGYEEPNLRARFGASYDDYRSQVGRWVPGLGRSRVTGRSPRSADSP